MDSRDKEKIRSVIDNIDFKILELIKLRREQSKAMAQYKLENGIAVSDPNREAQLLNILLEKAKEYSLPADFIDGIFKLIIADSVQLQEIYIQQRS